jgi:nicotinamidase-related amidase
MAMQLYGREVWTTLPEIIAPEHTAVLVVDMQNDFCNPEGALAERGANVQPLRMIVPALAQLIDSARRAGTAIVYLQMTLTRDVRYNSSADLSRRVKVWGSDVPVATIAGEWGHAVIDELTPEPGDFAIAKHRNNAFIGSDLNLLLGARGIKSVIVTGVATQACVLETALAAQGHDYYVVLADDCVASANPDDQQAALSVLRTVLHANGVVSSNQIVEHYRQLSVHQNIS